MPSDEDKTRSEDVERMAHSEGWKIISKWIEEQIVVERLLGADKDNFEKLQTEINTYKSVLAKVDEYINIKNEL